MAPHARGGEPSVTIGTVKDGPELSTALETLDPGVDTVVVGDDAAPDAEVVAAMLAAMGDADACMRSRPVTDAIKVVEGNMVVGSFDRSLLAHVGLPLVVRRRALDAVTPAVSDAAGIVHALLATGRRVRVLPE